MPTNIDTPPCLCTVCVWGQDFSIIVNFLTRGMFLKGMNDNVLLSKDERSLTPDIGKVMAIYVF